LKNQNYYLFKSFYYLAIFNLALCLDNGWGCEKNEKEAVKLYERASNLGNASGD